MRVDDLTYDLPPDRIATEPADPRDAARLMVVDRTDGRVSHHHVRDLPDVPGGPRSGDLLVFNDSRVIPARFEAVRRATGGRVGGLYIEQAPAGDGALLWRVMLESGGRLRCGEVLELREHGRLTLRERDAEGFWLTGLDSPLPTLNLLARIGTPPLPPYIRKARRQHGLDEIEPADMVRYNTVYAQVPGSVAAPTAGLHFTAPLLAELDRRGVNRATVTLHVGPGTFAPIRCDELNDHPMHEEWLTIPAATRHALARTRASGRRIIPVGTTSVRALESLPRHDAASDAAPDADFSTRTRLLIQPGPVGEPFAFRFADGLLTNFHLPRSTLLALVAALPGVGIDRLKHWYRQAAATGYHFYSYGDAMLIV